MSSEEKKTVYIFPPSFLRSLTDAFNIKHAHAHIYLGPTNRQGENREKSQRCFQPHYIRLSLKRIFW